MSLAPSGGEMCVVEHMFTFSTHTCSEYIQLHSVEHSCCTTMLYASAHSAVAPLTPPYSIRIRMLSTRYNWNTCYVKTVDKPQPNSFFYQYYDSCLFSIELVIRTNKVFLNNWVYLQHTETNFNLFLTVL